VQVFNSIGIGFGSLIAFSSYNKFQGPLLRDTIIVTLVDAGVSLVCGLAVFSVLGNLAYEQGTDVKVKHNETGHTHQEIAQGKVVEP
jgi:SNF family Na+-dependent transporter